MSNDYINELNKVGTEITHTLGSVAHQYGPQALDLVLGVERVQGLIGIVVGLIFLVLGVISGIVLSKQHFYMYSDNTCRPTIMLWSFPAFFSLISLANLSYIWNWVAVFNPQLAIAHDIISKLTSGSN